MVVTGVMPGPIVRPAPPAPVVAPLPLTPTAVIVADVMPGAVIGPTTPAAAAAMIVADVMARPIISPAPRFPHQPLGRGLRHDTGHGPLCHDRRKGYRTGRGGSHGKRCGGSKRTERQNGGH